MNKLQIRKANYRDSFNTIGFFYKDKHYESYAELAKDYKINLSTLYYRIRKGYPMSEVLKNTNYSPFTPIKDINGKEYRSIADLARKYGLSRQLLSHRLHSGMPIEQALEPSYKSKAICDHLGNKYKSITDMCKAYGINRTTYCCRIVYGYSKEEALTTPKGKLKKHEKHNEMCKLPTEN